MYSPDIWFIEVENPGALDFKFCLLEKPDPVIFSYFPAARAAKLKPVTILRHE